MTRYILHAYISEFDGVSFNTANRKPLLSPMRTGSMSRVLTLINGVAYNANGNNRGTPVYPIEQEFSVLITGSSGSFVDGLVYNIDVKTGQEGSLKCYVPDGSTYKCTAVLDEIERGNEAYMPDGQFNYGVYVLRFMQMDSWTSA